MSTLFSTLNLAGGALSALQNALDVSQNNVANASTPGYAKQTATLDALSFQLQAGLTGGVRAGAPRSSRNPLAEAAVQQQNSLLGSATQLQTSLESIQGVFDVSGTSGVSNSLTQLYSAFSSWSTEPGNAAYQNGILTAASQLATSFRQASQQVSAAQTSTSSALRSTVDQINHDAATISNLNGQIAQSGGVDAGVDAQLNSTLEDLSKLTNIQVVHQSDGTATVLLGGQTPLVSGTSTDLVTAKLGSPASIVDSEGTNITSQISSGQLQGLLSFANQTAPAVTSGLDSLAKSFADTVNGVLGSAGGAPLFTYGTGSNTAATIAVNPSLTPSQLVAADPGPPAVANGIALKLSNIDSTGNFTQSFAALASNVGTQLSTAQANVQVQTNLVSQADALRQQVSGVSLDQEAIQILQLQSSYQAASKVVTVVDELTASLMSMIV